MSKLRAPGKEATVRFSVDMSESVHRKLSMLAACDGAQESGPSQADAAGGWVKGSGWAKAIVLAPIMMMKKFWRCILFV